MALHLAALENSIIGNFFNIMWKSLTRTQYLPRARGTRRGRPDVAGAR